jgi:1,4-alpha-glucan branching enzyme
VTPDTTLSAEDIEQLVGGELHDPFALLGAHPLTLGATPFVAVRTLLPGARSVAVLDLEPGREIAARRLHEQGLFEAVLEGPRAISPYRLKVDFGTRFHPTG